MAVKINNDTDYEVATNELNRLLGLKEADLTEQISDYIEDLKLAIENWELAHAMID